MRVFARNVAYNLVGQLAPMAVALFSLPLLAKHAGADRLGFLGLAWALIGYFALLDLGLSRVVTRRVALAHAHHVLEPEQRVVIRLCNAMFVVVALISLVLAVVIPVRWILGPTASPELVDEARVALVILWATVPATVVIGLLRGTLEGLQRFGRANALRSIFGIWSFAAPIAILPFSAGLPALTFSIAAGRYVALVAYVLVVIDALRLERRAAAGTTPAAQGSLPPLAASDLRGMLREGGWLSVSNLVGPVMVTFDRFAIARLVSLAAAGFYFVPQEISLRLLVIPAAVAATIFPMFARSIQGGSDHARISHDALLATACASLLPCIAISALAGPALQHWMGEDFAINSAPVAAILAVGLFANCCAQVPFAWIQAVGRPDVTGKLHLLQLPFYCVLLCAVTWTHGIVGAAVVWSARAVADYFLLVAATRRLFPHLHLRRNHVEIGGALVTLVALTAARYVPHPAIAIAACAAVGVAIATVMAYRLRGALRR